MELRHRNQGGKRIYLEVLRIIACFYVIYNHTEGFHLYLNGDGGIKTFFAYCFSALAKMSVPIFFMISGSLLLTKEKSRKRRIIQILIIIVISNIMAYIKNNIHIALSVIDCVESMFAGAITVGYWYLYAYLAVLIMLPFLKDIAKQLDECKFKYLLLLHFLFCTVLPMIEYILSNIGITLTLNGNLSIPFAVQNSIFFMLIGFYIDNKIDIGALSKFDFIKIGIGTLFGIIVSAMFTYHQGMKYGFSQNFFQCVDYLIAIFIFLVIKKFFKSRAGKSDYAFVCNIGSLTFGIYLMEPFFRTYIYRYVMRVIPSNIPIILYSMLYSLIAMVIVGAITYVVKYILAKIGIKDLI